MGKQHLNRAVSRQCCLQRHFMSALNINIQSPVAILEPKSGTVTVVTRARAKAQPTDGPSNKTNSKEMHLRMIKKKMFVPGVAPKSLQAQKYAFTTKSTIFTQSQ